MSAITSIPSTKASPSSSSTITNCVTAPLPKYSRAPNATSPPNRLRRGHSQQRLRRQHLRHRHHPPYRQPACQRLHWLCLGPPPSQRRSSANHSQRHRTLNRTPSTTALAPPYAASSAAPAPAPPPMASDAAHTRPGTAAFSATPCATSTSLTWWVKAAACLLITLAALLLTPPPVAPPEAQDLSTSWLRADYYGPCHTHSPSAGALPGASRAPLPKVGVALPDAMCRSRAPAGRFPCSRRARAARAAPPLPPVPRGSLEPLYCRAEAARVLVQEPRSPRVVSTGMIPCTRSSMPIDDGRVLVDGHRRRRPSNLHVYRARGPAQRVQLLRSCAPARRR